MECCLQWATAAALGAKLIILFLISLRWYHEFVSGHCRNLVDLIWVHTSAVSWTYIYWHLSCSTELCSKVVLVVIRLPLLLNFLIASCSSISKGLVNHIWMIITHAQNASLKDVPGSTGTRSCAVNACSYTYLCIYIICYSPFWSRWCCRSNVWIKSTLVNIKYFLSSSSILKIINNAKRQKWVQVTWQDWTLLQDFMKTSTWFWKQRPDHFISTT